MSTLSADNDRSIGNAVRQSSCFSETSIETTRSSMCTRLLPSCQPSSPFHCCSSLAMVHALPPRDQLTNNVILASLSLFFSLSKSINQLQSTISETSCSIDQIIRHRDQSCPADFQMTPTRNLRMFIDQALCLIVSMARADTYASLFQRRHARMAEHPLTRHGGLFRTNHLGKSWIDARTRRILREESGCDID